MSNGQPLDPPRTPWVALRPSDLLSMAGASLKANKLRSFLTMLGITVGVFSVVGVMTALSAVKESIDSGLNVLGAGVFSVQRFPAIRTHSTYWKYRNRPPIDYRTAKRFQKEMEQTTPVVCLKYPTDWGIKVSYGNRETAPRMGVIGTNEHFLVTNNFRLNYGRNLTEDDLTFVRPVVVINSAIERLLFPHENPLDKWITVGRFRYRVVGVLEEKGKIFGEDQDTVLLVPASRIVSEYGDANRWEEFSLQVQAPNPLVYNETWEAAIGAMRLARGLPPEKVNDFEIVSNDSLLDAFNKVAVVVQTGGFIISFIALAAAGVGIMNIMLVSVTERTREIGIRKSLGARRRDILRQFLLEAVFLAQVGGLFGILLGAAAGNTAAHFMNAQAIFPWFWAAAAVAICGLVGVSFGLYPAWKAARLHPVEALRYE